MVAWDLGKAENKFQSKQHDYIYMLPQRIDLATLCQVKLLLSSV